MRRRVTNPNKSIIVLSGIIAINTIIASLAMIDIKEIKENTTPTTEVVEVEENTSSLIELTDMDGNKIIVSESDVDELPKGTIEKTIHTKAKNTKQLSIPNYDTSFKSYMNYTCITNKSSKQYKLQQRAWTDDCGLRRINDDYLVAMGTYYGTVGDRFLVTLEDNNQITVMMGDVKADEHTDDMNMYRAVYDGNGEFISANVIEFIVDTSEMTRKVRNLGTVGGYSHLAGNIIKIEKIEESEIE